MYLWFYHRILHQILTKYHALIAQKGTISSNRYRKYIVYCLAAKTKMGWSYIMTHNIQWHNLILCTGRHLFCLTHCREKKQVLEEYENKSLYTVKWITQVLYETGLTVYIYIMYHIRIVCYELVKIIRTKQQLWDSRQGIHPPVSFTMKHKFCWLESTLHDWLIEDFSVA